MFFSKVTRQLTVHSLILKHEAVCIVVLGIPHSYWTATKHSSTGNQDYYDEIFSTEQHQNRLKHMPYLYTVIK